MGNSEYLRQNLHIDTMAAYSNFGETTSKSTTWDLSTKTLPDLPSEEGLKARTPFTHCRRRAMASADLLKRHSDLSNTSSSDLEDGLSTGSWTASEESLVDYAVAAGQSPQVPYYDDWNSWFPPERTSQQTLPIREPDAASTYHGCPSPEIPMTNTKNDSAHMIARKPLFRAHLKEPQLKKQRSCIAFPQVSPTQQAQPPVRFHQSWSLESKASRPQLRDRANTGPQHQLSNSTSSNLTTCISIDDVHSSRLSYNSSPDYNEHLYMRSPPTTPLKTSFSSMSCSSIVSPQESLGEEFTESALTAFISQQSYFFHNDDDGEEEKSWLERQRAKFHHETRGYYIDPSTLPLMSDPPRLTPARHLHQRSDSSISSSFQKSGKPAKKKKSSLGQQAKELFSFSSLTSRKSSAKLSAAYRGQESLDTPPPSPPFSAPPFISTQQKEQSIYVACSSHDLNTSQQHFEAETSVTCHHRAPMCFKCSPDWTNREGGSVSY